MQDDLISRQAVLSYIYNDLGLGDEENGKDVERQMELEDSYRYVKSLPPVNPQEPKTGCEGCIYEKTGNNSTYPCSHCGRCYTDKYKAESEPQEISDRNLKMWEDIYAEEKRREGSDKECTKKR